QAMDLLAIDEVRNLLFGNAGAGSQDLIARDIQRARDNGLPDYNTLRVAYGLPPVTSFAEITSNVQVQQELEQAYGSVDNIDAFEGGLAEDHVAGSDVGPLFRTIMIDQFTRLRDGDRFFYPNERFSPDERRLIQGTFLAKIHGANQGLNNLQSNFFFFPAPIRRDLINEPGNQGWRRKRSPRRPCEVEDDSGNVLATTVTDSQ